MRDFNFADNVPMLKIVNHSKNKSTYNYLWYNEHMKFGYLLFENEVDYQQKTNIIGNQEIIDLMVKKMIILMKENEAPHEQYERLSLI